MSQKKYMCCNYSVLKQTENGMLLYLKGCKKYQLTFNNLSFSLSKHEIDSLKKYLANVNIEFWEKEYQHSVYTKKIPIPTLQHNFMILINRFELYELLLLLNFNSDDEYLNFKQLKDTIIWN